LLYITKHFTLLVYDSEQRYRQYRVNKQQ